MPDRKPLRVAVDEFGAPSGLAEFAAGDTVPSDMLAANLSALAALTGAADSMPYFTGAGALALADYTAVARTFDAALTTVAQRAVLGLGTAAVAAVQTSATDATAGRLLAVGAFGYGTTVAPPVSAINTDLNLVLTSGIYRIGGAETNAPITPAGGHVLEVLAWDGGTVYQNYYAQTRRFTRKVGSAWLEVFTSSGTNAITADSGSIGYGTGSGGTVTQATSKATGVTLNKPSGRITTAATALAANSRTSFLLNNSKIAATDIVLVTTVSGAGISAYRCEAWGVGAGIVYIAIENITAGSLSDAININFVVIKGATA
jgi:hypothetical protein